MNPVVDLADTDVDRIPVDDVVDDVVDNNFLGHHSFCLLVDRWVDRVRHLCLDNLYLDSLDSLRCCCCLRLPDFCCILPKYVWNPGEQDMIC